MKTIKAWAVVNNRGILRTAERDGDILRLPYCIYTSARQAREVAEDEIAKADVVRVEIREVKR